MHKILEAGYGNYLMVIFLIIGIIGTWIAAHQYKQLIRDSENMMGTRQPFLLQIKNKFQNTYYVNHGVNNVELFVQKNMKEIQKYRINTGSLSKLAGRMSGICFLLGIVLASLGYVQNISFKAIMTYLLTGIVTGLISLVFVYLLDVQSLQEMLCLQLKEYLENTFTTKLNHSREDREYLAQDLDEEEDDEDLSYLKQSLESMASDREKGTSSEHRHKLTAKEEKLLEEILKEYFA